MRLGVGVALLAVVISVTQALPAGARRRQGAARFGEARRGDGLSAWPRGSRGNAAVWAGVRAGWLGSETRATAGGGLTLDGCTRDAECKGSRVCVGMQEGRRGGACDGAGGCACVPGSGALQTCSADEECEAEERCLALGAQPGGGSICVSKRFAGGAAASARPAPGGNGTGTGAAAAAAGPGDGSGDGPGDGGGDGGGTLLTFDACGHARECLPPRTCGRVEPGPGGAAECAGDAGCVCFDRAAAPCGTDGECVSGETCFDGSRGRPGSDRRKYCVSEAYAARATAASPEPSESPEGGVCVAARHLRGVPRGALVFAADRAARVLCDAQGSCATPGHVVVWRGEAMMMRRYCREAGCVGAVMWVNSPRYRRGARWASRSNGLLFTPLAARFASQAEEIVLAAAVRLGL